MKITCRLCRTQLGEFFTLDSGLSIDDDQEYKLVDIINKCLPLEAALSDTLPQYACAECVNALKLFYPFVQNCIQSDNELKELFLGSKEEEELPAPVFGEQEEERNKFAEMFDYIQNNLCEDENNVIETVNQNNETLTISDAEIVYEIDDETTDSRYDFEESLDAFVIRDKSTDCTTEPQYAISTTGAVWEEPTALAINIQVPSPENTDEPCTIVEPLKEVRKFECFDCGRKYGSLLNLEMHRQLHNVTERKQCQVCDAVFEVAFDYKEHMKSHLDERKFICEFCNKPFMTRASLKSHLHSHYNIRPFKCEVCGKAFQQKSILKTHMTLHTGKTVECKVCKKRFSRTAHLNVHLRQHFNVRPYKCEHCSNSYVQKSHLDRHIASSHMGIRYECSECERSYSKQSTLTAHMRQEHEEHVDGAYICALCDREFKSPKRLHYHIKSMHADYAINAENMEETAN